VSLAALLLTGCLGKKNAAPVAGTSVAPDKVLYEKASGDVKHGRYATGRLALQTLINTYPDSEYLAKAKLEIANSYYKEGGTSGLKQSIVECKDFITFFPFLDEAASCQLQIAMAHYHQMEKPDRDHAEAVQAEAEFQTFLEKYPSSPLAPQAEQHLREVQEVLAEGNFRVASFYYLRQAYRASGARLIELTNRYPLYSQADQANWMLGQIYEKTEHNEIAARYYSRIVKDYPLSALAGDAKNKLVKFGVPVPPPDPTAVARMQKEQAADRPGLIVRSMGVLKTGPDVSTAARYGAPTMTPASESGDETIGFSLQPNANAAAGSSIGSSVAVETVTPGSPNSLPPAETAPATNATPATTDSTTQPAATGSTSDPGTAQPTTSTTPATPADPNQESTSKKKKGVRKLIPF
jgi:outer membrane protein assembly factor BamD